MATITTPPNWNAQAQAALARANEVRCAAVALRGDLAAGAITLAEALRDERAASITVLRLLLACPCWGKDAARAELRRGRISEGRRVRELTERQIELLAATRLKGAARRAALLSWLRAQPSPVVVAVVHRESGLYESVLDDACYGDLAQLVKAGDVVRLPTRPARFMATDGRNR